MSEDAVPAAASFFVARRAQDLCRRHKMQLNGEMCNEGHLPSGIALAKNDGM